MPTIDAALSNMEAGFADHLSRPVEASLPCSPIRARAPDAIGDPNVKLLLYTRRASRAATVLACLALLFTVYFGRSFLLPVTLAFVLALLFRPIVRRLQKWKVPAFIGAGTVIVGVIAAVAACGYYLVEPAATWIDRAPPGLLLKELEDKLEPIRGPMNDFSEASEQLERMAQSTESGHGDKVATVEVQQPSIAQTVVNTTGEFVASSCLCLILLYFLLTLGDSLLNSVVQVMPRLREKKEVVSLIRNVERGISSYLLIVTTINAALGVVIGLTMWMVGLPNPALWGVMAAALNFIPYIGAFAGSGIVFLVGLFTFSSIGEAAIAPLAYFAINAAEGNLITPAILGKRMSLNPIVVFLSLAFWGWMWGIGGALLAVPLLAIFKIACDQFECTRPLSALVSR